MISKDEKMELYRIMVDTVTANEQRRQQISSVFITLLAAGFGAAGAIKDFNMIYVSAAAAAVSIVWFAQIKFLKKLATAKFHVIGQIEKQMSYRPFEEEWNFMKPQQSKKRWQKIGLSDIEMIVPMTIFIVCTTHLLIKAWSTFCHSTSFP